MADHPFAYVSLRKSPDGNVINRYVVAWPYDGHETVHEVHDTFKTKREADLALLRWAHQTDPPERRVVCHGECCNPTNKEQ